MSASQADHSSDIDAQESDLDGFDDDPEDDAWPTENDDLMYLKYCFEGASSISELATALRLLADDLERRESAGWFLVEPINGGWAHLERASGSASEGG